MAITLSNPAFTAPEPRGFRTWLRRIMTGGQIVETCPSYCTDSHATDERGALDDLQHGASLPGVLVDVDDWQSGTTAMPVLAPRIAVDPYSSDPSRRAPHVLLEVFQDEFTQPLNPDEFAEVIAKLRGHLDQLEADVLPLLRRAIAEAEGGR